MNPYKDDDDDLYGDQPEEKKPKVVVRKRRRKTSQEAGTEEYSSEPSRQFLKVSGVTTAVIGRQLAALGYLPKTAITSRTEVSKALARLEEDSLHQSSAWDRNHLFQRAFNAGVLTLP